MRKALTGQGLRDSQRLRINRRRGWRRVLFDRPTCQVTETWTTGTGTWHGTVVSSAERVRV